MGPIEAEMWKQWKNGSKVLASAPSARGFLFPQNGAGPTPTTLQPCTAVWFKWPCERADGHSGDHVVHKAGYVYSWSTSNPSSWNITTPNVANALCSNPCPGNGLVLCHLSYGHAGRHQGQGSTWKQVPIEVVDTSKYPHKCPSCKAPAYMGLNSVDCSAKCKE